MNPDLSRLLMPLPNLPSFDPTQLNVFSNAGIPLGLAVGKGDGDALIIVDLAYQVRSVLQSGVSVHLSEGKTRDAISRYIGEKRNLHELDTRYPAIAPRFERCKIDRSEDFPTHNERLVWRLGGGATRGGASWIGFGPQDFGPEQVHPDHVRDGRYQAVPLLGELDPDCEDRLPDNSRFLDCSALWIIANHVGRASNG